jgi:hypothetical protein
MKTFEERAREIAAGIPLTARVFVPTALITLLIDICKTLDQLTKEKS